jgi:ferredoxin-thioredoxin reductase catalytic chain
MLLINIIVQNIGKIYYINIVKFNTLHFSCTRLLLLFLVAKKLFTNHEGKLMSGDQVNNIPSSLEAMRKFSETYAKRTGTFFCIDSSVTAVVVEGLAKHKDAYGAPLCPCRHYDDKQAEVQAAYWNCPCVPMRERKECHCMLFLTSNNEFAGNHQNISSEALIAEIR